MSFPRLTLLIPVFNGEPYIKNTLRELEEFFRGKNYLQEIIFINDGSTDRTQEILESEKQNTFLALRLLHLEKNGGKGYALKQGVEISQDSDVIAFTDIELPYGLDSIEKAFGYLASEEKVDFVVGDRTLSFDTQKQYSLYRKMFKGIFRFLLPLELRHIRDTQSGLKVFSASVAKDIFSSIQSNRWVFDIEIFLIALRRHYHFLALPVTVKESCRSGRGGVTFLKHSFQILKDLKHISLYDKNGFYNKK